jgi:hypothetical protein
MEDPRQDGHHWNTDHKTWQAKPGNRKGPRRSIGKFLTDAYAVLARMRKLHRVGDEPLKGEFCTLLGASRPSVNKYLAGGGLSWPLPPPDHLVWVTDIDDRSLLWVSPSLAAALQYETEEMLGQDARLLLRGQRPSEPGHREAIQALIDDANDGAYHDCDSAFVRKDGLWIPLRLRVTYGGLYRVWFADAVQTGVPFVFPAAKQTRQRTERAAVLVSTQPVVTVSADHRRLVLDATALQHVSNVTIEYGTWRPPPMPSITIQPQPGFLKPIVPPVIVVEQ